MANAKIAKCPIFTCVISVFCFSFALTDRKKTQLTRTTIRMKWFLKATTIFGLGAYFEAKNVLSFRISKVVRLFFSSVNYLCAFELWICCRFWYVYILYIYKYTTQYNISQIETVERRTRNVWYEQNIMSECKIVIHVDSIHTREKNDNNNETKEMHTNARLNTLNLTLERGKKIKRIDNYTQIWSLALVRIINELQLMRFQGWIFVEI